MHMCAGVARRALSIMRLHSTYPARRSRSEGMKCLFRTSSPPLDGSASHLRETEREATRRPPSLLLHLWLVFAQ